MKKLFYFGAISLLSLLFISCTKKNNSKEIEFLTGRTDFVNGTSDAAGNKDLSTAYYKILADKFEQKTGIKVKLTAYQDYNNSIRRRFASGNYGDVITGNEFTEKTIKTFFQPYGSKSQYKGYKFLNYSTFNDKVYGISPGYYIDGVVFNKKLLREAGYNKYPETLSQLHKLFKKIKSMGKTPVIINRATNWALGSLGRMGCELSGNPFAFNEMWKSNSPFSKSYPFGEALFEVATWVHNGWVESEFIPMWEKSKTQLAKGNVFMMYLGSWVLPQIQARARAINNSKASDIDFIPFPKQESSKKHFVMIEPEQPFYISKKTKYPEACKKWVSYLLKSNILINQGALSALPNIKTTEFKSLKKIIEEEADGKYTFIEKPPMAANGGDNTTTILKDMDIFADNKYIGFPLDKARISMKDFDKYIKQLNEQFNSVRKARGYTSN